MAQAREKAVSGGETMRLNLGCCDRHQLLAQGWINVDIAPPCDYVCDLAGPWPWDTSSIEEVFAGDVIEHIANDPWGRQPKAPLPLPWTEATPFLCNGRIHFMNELHRVLIPGARAVVETPNAAHGVGYYQDPTHVSPFCLSTFKYFESGAFAHQRLSKPYGITAAFKVIELVEMESSGEDARERVWKIRAVLEAVK